MGGSESASEPGFQPSASLPMLRRRAELLRSIRQFFDERGFLEVETPLLSADTVVDLHIEPIQVAVGGRTRWLQTSPEFAMKRLLAAGAEKIYQITRAFRGGESGSRHNVEFTILEWYRAGDSYHEGIELLADFAEAMELGRPHTVRIADAFVAHAGVNPHTATTEELADAARRFNEQIDFAADRDGWIDSLLVNCIEPQLAAARSLVLCDYPASQAALAEISKGQPPVAQRFELYANGVELGNGYYELCDASELRTRIRETNRLRAEQGLRALPEESRLLAAMEHGLPPSAGVAVGVDRLLMVQTGSQSIEDVIAFPDRNA